MTRILMTAIFALITLLAPLTAEADEIKIPTTLKGADSLTCVAVAVYLEARGESLEGQEAVASVIMQRARTPGRWGSAPCDVVKPVQFSSIRKDLSFAPIKDMDAWKTAQMVARTVLLEGPDPWLDGADHYHTTDVHPVWSKSMTRVATIGNHIFYSARRGSAG